MTARPISCGQSPVKPTPGTSLIANTQGDRVDDDADERCRPWLASCTCAAMLYPRPTAASDRDARRNDASHGFARSGE